MLYEVKPLNRYSFKGAMETRFSPISIDDSFFLSSSCNLYFLLRTRLFDVYHGRRVCKRLNLSLHIDQEWQGYYVKGLI